MNHGITPNLDEMLALRFKAPGVGLFSRQRVEHSHAGGHLSTSRGRGIDFSGTRPYYPGDDIRLINWKLTAKMGKAYTKVYQEERERPVYFVIDQTHVMSFGTHACFKNVLAANVFALLGWSALSAEQQVGSLLVGDNKFTEIVAKRSRQPLLQSFKQLSEWKNEPGEAETIFANSLQRLYQQAKAGSIVF